MKIIKGKSEIFHMDSQGPKWKISDFPLFAGQAKSVENLNTVRPYLQPVAQEICSELASEPADLLAATGEEGYSSCRKPNTPTSFSRIPIFCDRKINFYLTRASEELGKN